jgi:hypothetical protein
MPVVQVSTRGKLGSISNSLFDPAVSDPDSHIMQMDGANYSCQVPQTPARPNGGTSPFEITDTIWGGYSTTQRGWS